MDNREGEVAREAIVEGRRCFITLATTSALTATLLVGCHEEQEEGVSTDEDLMREHGILKRVLLS